MKLERLISIIYKLLNHDVLSASMLADEFQVSQRTIYRDIDIICAAGIPVVSYQGMKGGYGIMDGYKMDKSLLGSYDVSSLITVLHSLSTIFEDDRAQNTIERLKTIGAEHTHPSLAVNLASNTTNPAALPLLRKAIADRNVIRFDYINAKNERSTREMEPLRLHYKYRNWYVYGYCLARHDYREFRLSRMLDACATDRFFKPHEIMDTTASIDSGWSGSVEDVVIRVGPAALASAMDHFHLADKQFHPDGSMTMRIPVHQPLEARWLWAILLSFGSGAEVLEPRTLRSILKEQLIQSLKFYEEV
ncbi:DeoR family transcriptional regulator [Paenibacillus sp. CCS19]|uniref:helix-turn-helix transcriptional regulator n=1 Tax=Paenibacillus sp. CCS19 TaxID=3158387 RepID=UPI0025615E6A|nr:YafY family protein [Paenibacillus cellulosilyticus]GMK37554.1 DeoR family transcriptional regulator [Paenibacillus cellulosilyticus]